MRIVKKIVAAGLIASLCWCGIVADDCGEYPDKIWLHRCNSLEKLREFYDEYPNVEVDVVFRDDSRFDVTHDAEVSYGLDIEPYFGYLQRTDGKLWLDIKNLSLSNAAQMLGELEALVRQYAVDKDRLIIESPCWQALCSFTESGYYTSYYVAYEKPSQLDDDRIDACIRNLRNIVDRQAVSALSFPGWWYATLREELDRPQTDLLTWKHRTTQMELLALPAGHQMVNDPQLKVILIKDKGRYHR